VEADSSTLVPVHSYWVSAALDYHSFSMDDYYDDYLFIGINGNAIEIYGIEFVTQSYHRRRTFIDQGSQNYMAQGCADFQHFGWYMYAYGSAGKFIIFNHYI
jgi:hypothetical protein